MTRRKFQSGNLHAAARCGLVAAALLGAVARLALAETAPSPQTVPPPQPPTANAPAPAVPAVAPRPPESATAPTVPQPSAGPALPPQPPPPEKRGFLNGFGQWWDRSVADFGAKMKEQKSKLDDFNKDSAAATSEAMKNAADAMVRLPTSRVVEVQQVCPLAGNGAPDCQIAATSACQAKGFKTGQPADIRTAEKCSASLWVSGQAPPTTDDCPLETVVLRATCQ
ncbi:MAG: hypothetical protein ABSE22_20205 [Xanthobacteraceae bacterium]